MSETAVGQDALATLRADGSRRVLRPKLAHGRYLNRRRVIGYPLIALFVSLPFIRINGRPGLLIDIPERELQLLGASFHATDTVLLMLFVLGGLTTVFFTTAVAGRAWCGYACPQTVYLELVYRPLQRLIEGRGYRSGRVTVVSTIIKLAVYAVISVFLGNVFVAYFVGTDALAHWVHGAPSAAPVPFVAMLLTSALVFADFAWFREQMCSVVCPYARLQSALVDPGSVVVAYDRQRGEPRVAPRDRKETTVAGDCVDCSACVTVCPTGIDIRNGTQLECIACAQCADACDLVMLKRGSPLRLVGYTQPTRRQVLARPRVWVYGFILVAIAVAMTLLGRVDRTIEVSVLASLGSPYVVLGVSEIGQPLRLRLTNHARTARDLHLALEAGESALSTPENPVHLGPGESRTLSLLVRSPRDTVSSKPRQGDLVVEEAGKPAHHAALALIGPDGGVR